MRTEAEKKAQAKYDTKCKKVGIKYTLTDMKDYEALQTFLSESGLSANAYIKQLIYNDLIDKGYL